MRNPYQLKSGLLHSAGRVATRGRTPRFIGFDPSQEFLYGANEQSDTIVAWSVDRTNGRVTPADKPAETARGNMGVDSAPTPKAYKRANYMMMLQSREEA